MRKIIYIFAFSAITLLNSCQLVDVLDKRPPYEADLEGAITNAKTAELALIGVYSYLPQGTDDWMQQAAYSFRSGLMSKPEWFTKGNAVFYYERSWPILSANSDTEWDKAYNIIKNANFLLTRVDAISDFKDGRRDELKGELYFLKGFAYHRLMIRFAQHWDLNSRFGLISREDAPAIGGEKRARMTVKDSYDMILDNLNKAITLAPKYGDSGYASSLAAKATKVKVLMDMGQYKDCIELANEVIGESYLEPSYANVFSNALTSKEVIFARKFGDSEISSMSTRQKAINEAFWGATESLVSLLGNDPRKEYIIGEPIQVKYEGVYSDKYTSIPVLKMSNETNNLPIIYLRSAEMYLIKAEATMRNGGSIADAWDPIAILRGRAGAPTTAPTTREQLEDEIFNEWIKELSFENGSEWMAVRRVGLDKLLNINALLKENFDTSLDQAGKRIDFENKRILSIPLEETNSNGVEQNPGY